MTPNSVRQDVHRRLHGPGSRNAMSDRQTRHRPMRNDAVVLNPHGRLDENSGRSHTFCLLESFRIVGVPEPFATSFDKVEFVRLPAGKKEQSEWPLLQNPAFGPVSSPQTSVALRPRERHPSPWISSRILFRPTSRRNRSPLEKTLPVHAQSHPVSNPLLVGIAEPRPAPESD